MVVGLVRADQGGRRTAGGGWQATSRERYGHLRHPPEGERSATDRDHEWIGGQVGAAADARSEVVVASVVDHVRGRMQLDRRTGGPGRSRRRDRESSDEVRRPARTPACGSPHGGRRARGSRRTAQPGRTCSNRKQRIPAVSLAGTRPRTGPPSRRTSRIHKSRSCHRRSTRDGSCLGSKVPAARTRPGAPPLAVRRANANCASAARSGTNVMSGSPR